MKKEKNANSHHISFFLSLSLCIFGGAFVLKIIIKTEIISIAHRQKNLKNLINIFFYLSVLIVFANEFFHPPKNIHANNKRKQKTHIIQWNII